MSNIIIKQSYFTNAQTAINSLNEFFSSGFKTRNFPVLDNDFQLEPAIEKIVSRLSSVDPTWIDDESKLTAVISSLNESCRAIDPTDGVYQTIVNSNNEALIGTIDSYIGFKYLQTISENFDDFTKFINGLYTFQLFLKPSEFVDVLDLFGRLINFDEVPDLDIEEKMFDEAAYISGLMKSDQVQLPPELTEETEVERMINRQDLQGVEVMVDDTVQEAAAINYFEDAKPTHLKYSEQHEKWMVSQQFQKIVNDLTSALRKCDTTDDLIRFFGNGMNGIDVNVILDTVCPYILAKAIANPNKYQGSDPKEEQLKKYTDSYDMIIKDNSGAARFKSYDIFSTFKTDKDGTIQFIEDFLKLNLVNRADATINNNTLVALFNIFDSRIYLDIAYNVAPDSIKNEKGEDDFVKEIRGRINKNSHTKNAYSKKEDNQEAPDVDENTGDEATETDDNNNDNTVENPIETSEQVAEYVSRELRRFSDMNPIDMMYCEEFSDIIDREIETLDDKLYNEGLSPLLIDEFIGESYNVDIDESEYIMEANITKRREKLQQAVCSVIKLMEKIVDLDKKHRWNDRAAINMFKTSTILMSDSEYYYNLNSAGYVDIKYACDYTKKALKGKYGNFDQKQLKSLESFYDIISDLKKNTRKFFSFRNYLFKRSNIAKSFEVSDETKQFAVLAKKIVELKPELKFIYDDNFVNESYNYEQEYVTVYQEATTEVNNKRLNTAIDLLKRDMTKIVELAKKKQWNNNACISMFKGETYGVVKQALKYTNRAMGGSCGKYDESQVEQLRSLRENLEDIMKCVKLAIRNPFIGKNVKESNPVHKVSTLANEVLSKISSLDFIKSTSPTTSSDTSSDSSSDTSSSSESTTTESYYNSINDIDTFMMVMEQEDGSIPEYLKKRFDLSDDLSIKKEPAELPDGVPSNPIDDITGSIDYKLKSSGDDDYKTILGSDYEEDPDNAATLGSGKGGNSQRNIVVNVTNNYTNSFNRDSYNKTSNSTKNDDHSTGKTTNVTNTNSHNKTNSDNDSSHDNRSDSSSNKVTKANKSTTTKLDHSNRSRSTTSGSNNNNNNNGTDDTYDSPSTKDKKQKLSSGKTIAEMFTFLESSEPQSLSAGVNTPPKEDLLTKAMDKDRETLAKQQESEKGIQKAINTVKAGVKPIERKKNWMRKMVDSIIKRDEDKVKDDLLNNSSYRSSVFKLFNFALKAGFLGVCFAITPHLGVFFSAVFTAKWLDKPRLQAEAQRNLETEIAICKKKIEYLDRDSNPKNKEEMYKYMRLKSELEKKLMTAPKKNRRSTYFDDDY